MTLIGIVDRQEDFGRRQIVQIKSREQRLTERPIESISHARQATLTAIDHAQIFIVDEIRKE